MLALSSPLGTLLNRRGFSRFKAPLEALGARQGRSLIILPKDRRVMALVRATQVAALRSGPKELQRRVRSEAVRRARSFRAPLHWDRIARLAHSQFSLQ